MGTGRNNSARPAAAVGPGGFETTRWTLVLTAGADGSASARRALSELCAAYWYPLYAFVRRQGHDPDSAQDLTQGFFARLLERRIVATADPARGRFRAYLLGALKHFLADERDRAAALKRGGGRVVSSIDSVDLREAETRYAAEPAHRDTPEKAFDRRWAMTLLGEVLARLRAEMEADGKGPLFEALKDTLGASDDGRSYRDVGESLAMSEGAVKVAAHRLRRRYRELLRAQIAQTVASPGEVDDEIRHLFEALA